jgi:hypothetical protein
MATVLGLQQRFHGQIAISSTVHIMLYSYILLLRPDLRRELLVALDHQIRQVDRITDSNAVGRSALKDPT